MEEKEKEQEAPKGMEPAAQVQCFMAGSDLKVICKEAGIEISEVQGLKILHAMTLRSSGQPWQYLFKDYVKVDPPEPPPV